MADVFLFPKRLSWDEAVDRAIEETMGHYPPSTRAVFAEKLKADMRKFGRRDFGVEIKYEGPRPFTSEDIGIIQQAVNEGLKVFRDAAAEMFDELIKTKIDLYLLQYPMG